MTRWIFCSKKQQHDSIAAGTTEALANPGEVKGDSDGVVAQQGTPPPLHHGDLLDHYVHGSTLFPLLLQICPGYIDIFHVS